MFSAAENREIAHLESGFAFLSLLPYLIKKAKKEGANGSFLQNGEWDEGHSTIPFQALQHRQVFLSLY
jgi:hypothetical protein